MQRASRFFNRAQQKAIEEAVTNVEAKTSAEIVPVLATDSGRYDRAEDIAGLWLAAILVSVTWFLFRDAPVDADWGIAWGRFELPALLAAQVVGFAVGAIVAMRVAWLRRLFTSRAQMRAEVNLRAHQMFVDWRVHRTAADTGLLVYISLFERMTVVLADHAVLEVLGQAGLDRLCADLTPVLRSPDPTAGLCRFLEQLGGELGQKLPPSKTDTNELPNRLVIVD